MSKSGHETTDVDLVESGGTEFSPAAIHGHASTSETALVPVAFLGTPQDKHDMVTMGRVQQLRRNFNFSTSVSFTAVMMCSWELVAMTLVIALNNGGTGGLFWTYVAGMIGFPLVYLSLAEMASMAPTSCGQYHWVSELAPESCQKFLSFITAWTSFLGWQAFAVSASFILGTGVQTLIALNKPPSGADGGNSSSSNGGYTPQRWHGTLLVMSFGVLFVLANALFARHLPRLQLLTLTLHVLGLVALVTPLWARAPERRSVADALLDFRNGGGWSSAGVAVMVGAYGPMQTMLGYDCTVHIGEETRDASRNLPRAIILGAVFNTLLGFIAVITFCFTAGSAGSLDALLAPTSPHAEFPFIGIYLRATGSRAGTTAMVSVILLLFVVGGTMVVTTASRQLWSFARDHGLPFSARLAKVSRRWTVPLSALFVTLAVLWLFSLVNIGSAVALQASLTIGTSGLMTTYVLSIGCMLLRRARGLPLPPRRWPLGGRRRSRWLGAAVNALALAFLLPVLVFSFFPAATPVRDAARMNWGCAVYGGVLAAGAAYYGVRGRRRYTPPVALVRRGGQLVDDGVKEAKHVG